MSYLNFGNCLLVEINIRLKEIVKLFARMQRSKLRPNTYMYVECDRLDSRVVYNTEVYNT